MRSKRTKALDISTRVRKEVYDRDSWDGATCCVSCGTTRNLTLAHFISRARSGLGIAKNLVALCIACHEVFDRGGQEDRGNMREKVETYLQGCYGGSWCESELVYKREAFA